jgi:nitroreductase
MLNKLKSLAKQLLAVRLIAAMYENMTRAMLAVGGGSRLGATIYSTLGLVTFNREQWAVLAGRRAYYRNLRARRISHVELRRNVHRLEKGILMQPRRSSFAADYIEETVRFYVNAVTREDDDPTYDASELQWAFDVLTEYFAVVSDDHPAIARARQAFSVLDHRTSAGESRPYPHSLIKRSDVEYNDMLMLAEQRRSVRWYRDEPVPRELIDKALLVARQSPSACNRLPYEFLVYDEPETVAKVSKIPFGAAGYGHQIPTLVVVTGRLDSYFSPRDRHVIYIDASLASMAFMFALETLGLASSVINWPDFEPLERRMQKTLGIPPHQRVIMLMAVGWPAPDGMVAYSQKKSLEGMRRFNQLGG